MIGVKHNRGFTLVEIIGVIVILSILLVIMIPNVSRVSDNSKKTLKQSKINTLIAAGEKYGNEVINKYQNCVGEGGDLSNCTVSIRELIEKGYVESEKNDADIVDPTTNEAMTGKVLLCYNPRDVNVYGTYVEEEDSLKCGTFSIDGKNSLNLSSSSGNAYVGGDKVEVNIIERGISSIDCINPDPSLVKCEVVGKEKLVLTPTKTQFSGVENKKVILTLKGTHDDGDPLEKTYTLKIYPTALSIKKPTPEDTCLPVASTDIYSLNRLNEGEIFVTSSDDDILEGSARDGSLYIASKKKTGTATLTISENNGNNSDTITKNIYELIVGDASLDREVPRSLVINNSYTVPIKYSGTGPITISSTDSNVVHFSSPSNAEAGTITLSSDTEFTIIAKKSGTVKITVSGSSCGYFESNFSVSNLSLKETSGTVYTGGSTLSTEIITKDTTGLTCISSNSSAATCAVHATTLEIYPGDTADDKVVLTVKGDSGEVTYNLKVLPTSIEIVDRSGIPVDTVCTKYSSNVNDKEIFARGTNMGDTTVQEIHDWYLADVTVEKEGTMRKIDVVNRDIEAGMGVAPYNDGYNTGVTLIDIKENNGRKIASFNYRIYSLESDEDTVSMKANETSTVKVSARATGEITATSSDSSIASVEVEATTPYGDGVNQTVERNIKLTAKKAGTAIITIRGSSCGESKVRVNVTGRSLSIELNAGTYTESIGETTLSCTPTGILQRCEVTFPEITPLYGFEVIGWSIDKDSKTASYRPGDTITLTSSNSGTKYYGNSADVTRPVCSFSGASSGVKIGETTYYDLSCTDSGSGLKEYAIERNDFQITDTLVGEVTSITSPTPITNGYSYRVGIKAKKEGLFGISLKENVVVDNFDNGNNNLSINNIFATEYEAEEVWYIGKENRNDVIAALYDNSVLSSGERSKYTLKVYGSKDMVDFLAEDYPYYPPWYDTYRSLISSVEIADTITNIGDNFMNSMSGLTSVSLPENATYIGVNAFSNTNLSSITIPTSVKTIRENAFCFVKMTSLTLNRGLIEIGVNAFYGHNLTNITIPNSITAIGNYAFQSPSDGTSSLTSIIFENGSNLSEISEGAFLYHMATSLTIPSSVTKIKYRAFAQLDLNEHGTLKNLTFQSGSQLNTIEVEAFYGSDLSSLTFPSSLEIVDNRAFAGKNSGITTIHIGPKIRYLGDSFIFGKELSSFTVDASNNGYKAIEGVLYDRAVSELVKCPDDYYKTHETLNVPNTVTVLRAGSFNGWLDYDTTVRGFTLNLPSSVWNMNIHDNFISFTIGAINISGSDRFESENGVLFSKDKKTIYRLPTAYDATSYTVPNSVTKIDDNFAYGNIKVKTINVPDSVTLIGKNAFLSDANYALSTINLNTIDTVSFYTNAFSLMVYPEDANITDQTRTINVRSATLKNRIDNMYSGAPFKVNTVVQ